ncbi:MAG: hypothetical protein A4E28_00889 [Methanocella sp. PtaU1.Bin125]|nr:MAG: hypothetical protein A4E28_00889 [Methanocella sp. PtaU1.Bin125]
MYFREALNHNRPEGVKASEAANNIDTPLQDVLDACEKLDQTGLLDIEKRHMSGGKAQDLEAHITAAGIDYLQKEKGIPL